MDSMASRRERALWRSEHRGLGYKQLLLHRGFLLNADEPVHSLRRARAIAYVLDHYPVEIGDDDLLVGRYAPRELTDGDTAELALAARLHDAGHQLLGDLVQWHRREDRPAWWDVFRLQSLDREALIEDGRLYP